MYNVGQHCEMMIFFFFLTQFPAAVETAGLAAAAAAVTAALLARFDRAAHDTKWERMAGTQRVGPLGLNEPIPLWFSQQSMLEGRMSPFLPRH